MSSLVRSPNGLVFTIHSKSIGLGVSPSKLSVLESLNGNSKKEYIVDLVFNATQFVELLPGEQRTRTGTTLIPTDTTLGIVTQIELIAGVETLWENNEMTVELCNVSPF